MTITISKRTRKGRGVLKVAMNAGRAEGKDLTSAVLSNVSIDVRELLGVITALGTMGYRETSRERLRGVEVITIKKLKGANQ
jgi:hypothetical protein